jgi:hypothetical protein
MFDGVYIEKFMFALLLAVEILYDLYGMQSSTLFACGPPKHLTNSVIYFRLFYYLVDVSNTKRLAKKKKNVSSMLHRVM